MKIDAFLSWLVLFSFTIRHSKSANYIVVCFGTKWIRDNWLVINSSMMFRLEIRLRQSMVTWQSSIFCTRCFWQKYGCASFATKSDDNPTREIISTLCRRLTFSILNSYPTVNSHKKKVYLIFQRLYPIFHCTFFFLWIFLLWNTLSRFGSKFTPYAVYSLNTLKNWLALLSCVPRRIFLSSKKFYLLNVTAQIRNVLAGIIF